MSKHHEKHPEYAEMGIFAGYGEYDECLEYEIIKHTDGNWYAVFSDHYAAEEALLYSEARFPGCTGLCSMGKPFNAIQLTP